MNRRTFLQRAGGAAILATGIGTAGESPAAAPRFRAAIIGHTGRGNYGHGLDLLFAGRPSIDVVALADPDAGGRAKALARTGARRGYADFREMLERERPQLVAVAPRVTDRHHAMVKAALEVGAHVYCEKPFTRTLAEADELLALAARLQRRIVVAHQGRLAPSTLHFKQRLDEGLIGDLLAIRVHGKQDKRAGGEDMVVLGTHQFDLVRFLAGDPLWCSARILQGGREIVATDAHPATEEIGPVAGDEIEATFALPRGVNVHFTSRARYAAVAGPWGMELVGSRGVARLLNDAYPRTLVRRGDQWRPLENDPTAAASPEERSMAAGNRRLVDDWLAAIAGDREPVCSGQAGMKSLEMIHAVFAAGLSRGRVALPLENRRHPLAG